MATSSTTTDHEHIAYIRQALDEAEKCTPTPTAFCAVLLSKPKDGLVTIDRILPIREGDEVQLLGVPPKEGGLNWWVDTHKGVTLIKVKPTDVEAVKHAWAFKISYGGVSA